MRQVIRCGLLLPRNLIRTCMCLCLYSEVFVKSDGSLYVEGDLMYRKRLADTLDIIAADNGTWDMYNGSLAQSIVQDLHDIGELTGR